MQFFAGHRILHQDVYVSFFQGAASVVGSSLPRAQLEQNLRKAWCCEAEATESDASPEAMLFYQFFASVFDFIDTWTVSVSCGEYVKLAVDLIGPARYVPCSPSLVNW